MSFSTLNISGLLLLIIFLPGIIFRISIIKSDSVDEYLRTTIDFIEVDVLVSSSGKNFIYSGILLDYFLVKGNPIDKIYMINPLKKELDFVQVSEFISIPSDTIVIKNET